MTREQQKILKCLEEFYGGELDIDNEFSDITENDLDIPELIARLEVCYGTRLQGVETPKAYEFTLVSDWIEWVLNNLEK